LGDESSLRVGHAQARDQLIAAAREAGEIALGFFRHGEGTSARIDYKHGGSPVTQADIAVDDFLRERLGAAFPGAGWLSEETADDPVRLAGDSLIVVDPIDGTRGFVAGDARWAVSIALVRDGRPVAGVVHAPALGETFAAAAGAGAQLNGASIRVSRRETLAGARIGGPKPMIEAIGRAIGAPLVAQPRIPSLAYRLAQVARGAFDLGLASERSHDWDIAAADLILRESGGRLTQIDGATLRYNRVDTHRGALFAAPTQLFDRLLSAAHERNERGLAV